MSTRSVVVVAVFTTFLLPCFFNFFYFFFFFFSAAPTFSFCLFRFVASSTAVSSPFPSSSFSSTLYLLLLLVVVRRSAACSSSSTAQSACGLRGSCTRAPGMPPIARPAAPKPLPPLPLNHAQLFPRGFRCHPAPQTRCNTLHLIIMLLFVLPVLVLPLRSPPHARHTRANSPTCRSGCLCPDSTQLARRRSQLYGQRPCTTRTTFLCFVRVRDGGGGGGGGGGRAGPGGCACVRASWRPPACGPGAVAR